MKRDERHVQGLDGDENHPILVGRETRGEERKGQLEGEVRVKDDGERRTNWLAAWGRDPVEARCTSAWVEKTNLGKGKETRERTNRLELLLNLRKLLPLHQPHPGEESRKNDGSEHELVQSDLVRNHKRKTNKGQLGPKFSNEEKEGRARAQRAGGKERKEGGVTNFSYCGSSFVLDG